MCSNYDITNTINYKMKNVGVVTQTLMNGTSYWANLINGRWKQDLNNENPPTHDKYVTL